MRKKEGLISLKAENHKLREKLLIKLETSFFILFFNYYIDNKL